MTEVGVPIICIDHKLLNDKNHRMILNNSDLMWNAEEAKQLLSKPGCINFLKGNLDEIQFKEKLLKDAYQYY